MQRDWDARYRDGDLPWDTGRPDLHLVALRERVDLGSVLDIGCGTGTNAAWLAELGHRVVGVDLSPTAVAMARERTRDCPFHALDFLEDTVPGAPFDLAFDRGVFHVFDADDRARFALKVASLLADDGLWFSLIGSTDGPPRDTGPPRVSAADVARAVEPAFEILELRATVFDDGIHADKKAWTLLARRR